jgi:hypothetical protein
MVSMNPEIENFITTATIGRVVMGMSIALTVFSFIPATKLVIVYGSKAYHLIMFLTDLVLLITEVLELVAQLYKAKDLFYIVGFLAILISSIKCASYINIHRKIFPKFMSRSTYAIVVALIGIFHISFATVAIVININETLKFNFSILNSVVNYVFNLGFLSFIPTRHSWDCFIGNICIDAHYNCIVWDITENQLVQRTSRQEY